ncbi:MAG: FAD-dependent oxidoreductase [Bacteroidota bacterium]
MNSKTIIIGGGLSGLLIGYRLKQLGVPFILLEARNRIGGRIYTKLTSNNTPVEMGATWFGNQHKQLKKLLKELKLDYFEQFIEGTSFFQPLSTAPSNAITLPSQAPSYRISGGTSAIIKALKKLVGEENIMLNEAVQHINFENNTVTTTSNKKYEAQRVILALPPKLWSTTIHFSPALPKKIKDTALHTHTWMETSIKVSLTYKAPFWRNNDQSGVLFSNVGPITEFYDHSNADFDKYALCGFVNAGFSKLDFTELKELILAQITSVFGSEAQKYSSYDIVDWNKETYTATKNQVPLYPHQNNGNEIYRTTFYDNRLFISSSEVASAYSGYMEGAVISSNEIIEKIKALIE